MSASCFSRAMERMSVRSSDLSELHEKVKEGKFICRERVLKGPERAHCHLLGNREMVFLSGQGWLIRRKAVEKIVCNQIYTIIPELFHCVIPGEQMTAIEIQPRYTSDHDTILLGKEVSADLFDRKLEERTLIFEYYRQVVEIPDPTIEMVRSFSGPDIDCVRRQLSF